MRTHTHLKKREMKESLFPLIKTKLGNRTDQSPMKLEVASAHFHFPMVIEIGKMNTQQSLFGTLSVQMAGQLGEVLKGQ